MVKAYKGHEDHAEVDTETVTAPQLAPDKPQGKHSPAGPIIIAADTNELGSNDCPDVVEVIWGWRVSNVGFPGQGRGEGTGLCGFLFFCSL